MNTQLSISKINKNRKVVEKWTKMEISIKQVCTIREISIHHYSLNFSLFYVDGFNSHHYIGLVAFYQSKCKANISIKRKSRGKVKGKPYSPGFDGRTLCSLILLLVLPTLWLVEWDKLSNDCSRSSIPQNIFNPKYRKYLKICKMIR